MPMKVADIEAKRQDTKNDEQNFHQFQNHLLGIVAIAAAVTSLVFFPTVEIVQMYTKKRQTRNNLVHRIEYYLSDPVVACCRCKNLSALI